MPELRDRDGVLGEHLEQERLELVVGPVDLVDEQHRRHAARRRGERPQQRPSHEEGLGVELALERLGAAVGGRAAGLGGAQVQQLAGVVPLVHGLVGVEALVALEPDQLAARPRRDGLGDLGLADTGVALEQQRPLQPEREEDRRGQPLVGEVALTGEGCLHRVDRVDRDSAHEGGGYRRAGVTLAW